MITAPEYMSAVDGVKIHIDQELTHASTLAERVAFHRGTPATTARPIAPFNDSHGALQSDLDLETEQLDRYRTRVEQATDLGLIDVAEALRPLGPLLGHDREVAESERGRIMRYWSRTRPRSSRTQTNT